MKVDEKKANEIFAVQLICIERRELAGKGFGCYPYDCTKCELYNRKGTLEEVKEALDIGRKCIQEIQKYRELGTVEELREAMEKQRLKFVGYAKTKPVCRMCGEGLIEDYNFCPNCGQALDWLQED